MMKFINISFLLILLLAGCYPSYYNLEYRFEGRGNYIKGVPFFPQEENYCGPAALAGVLGYWGHNVSQEEVAREVFTPVLKGTITVDMVKYAQRKGFDAVQYQGDLEKLKERIDAGYPLILFLNIGTMIPKRHYMVVVGYDETRNAVIAYSGKEKDILIPYDRLLKTWGRTGYWTLLILPNQAKGTGQ